MAMALFTQKDIDAAVEDEQKRWCEELDFLHTEFGADCSGCDSGDPLDCVEVEIRQAIAIERERMGKGILRLIDDLDGQVTESGYLSYTSPFGQWITKDMVFAATSSGIGGNIPPALTHSATPNHISALLFLYRGSYAGTCTVSRGR